MCELETKAPPVATRIVIMMGSVFCQKTGSMWSSSHMLRSRGYASGLWRALGLFSTV
jgi:hypothetical protein